MVGGDSNGGGGDPGRSSRYGPGLAVTAAGGRLELEERFNGLWCRCSVGFGQTVRIRWVTRQLR